MPHGVVQVLIFMTGVMVGIAGVLLGRAEGEPLGPDPTVNRKPWTPPPPPPPKEEPQPEPEPESDRCIWGNHCFAEYSKKADYGDRHWAVMKYDEDWDFRMNNEADVRELMRRLDARVEYQRETGR